MTKKILIASVALLPIVAMTGQAQSRMLTRHMRDSVRTGEARPAGRLASNQIMNLDLVLPLRDQAGLTAFLKDLYDPNSSSYRHYVTPAEFTARFGPTQESYDRVLNFARANGLQVVGGSRDGMDVQVEGTVSAIENAFQVTMATYRHPTENRTFYSPDREPAANLPFALWHIAGMDNYSIPQPLLKEKTAFAKEQGISPNAVVTHATTGSGPSASFLGSDMRAAYYGSGSLTGAGQRLGLLEFKGANLADVTTYYSNAGQTNNVPINLIAVDRSSTSCNASSRCDDSEQTLDITQALGMAPGLAGLDVYIGSTDAAIISAMTTHNPLPTTIGCSWGWSPTDRSTLDPYFQKMAAQGQTFFAASGDSSTWSSKVLSWPADDAYVVAVGGTDLVTTGAAGAWASETAWLDSGGGVSPNSIAIPAWQQLSGVINSSNGGSTTLRNGPDVSANANFTFYVCANQTTCTANKYGGTSFAAPMWAAFMALANQQSIANGKGLIGFINPTIYSQNVTSAYATNFHDVTSGVSGSFSAVQGYDLVTGWGSPQLALINALAAGATTTPSLSLSASPAAVSVVQGSSGSSVVTTSVSGGFNSTVALTATGQPSGATVTFSPSSLAAPGAGTSTMTIAVAASTAAGTYSITVTGTGGGITKTAVVSLVVTASSAGTFTIAVSPSSGSLNRGTSGRATVTTKTSGGFNAAIQLSATGLPSGVTAAFSPASGIIAAPGSGSTSIVLTVSTSAATGKYPITITGTGGGVAKSTTLTLQVR